MLAAVRVLTAALVKAGFEATGIDQSSALLRISRAAVPRAHFIHESIYDAEIPPCEAILAIGEPLTYHAEGADAGTLSGDFWNGHLTLCHPAGCSSSM